MAAAIAAVVPNVGSAIDVCAAAGIEAEVINGATIGGEVYHAAYLNEPLNKKLIAQNTAVYDMQNGTRGEKIPITEKNISDDADLTKEGVTSLTIEVSGFCCSVPIYVYKTQTIQPLEPDRIGAWASAFDFHFETQIPGGESTVLATTNIIENPQYGIGRDMLTLRTPALYGGGKSYDLHTVGHASQKQMLAFFSNINASNLQELPVGSVLEFNDDFRFYYYQDTTYVAKYKLSENAKYVWTGDEWKNFVADTRDFTLDAESLELPVGASYQLSYTLQPEGSYISVSVTSSNENVAAVENGNVRCLKEGTTVLTVTAGNLVKSVNVTVKRVPVSGFRLTANRVYYVSQGAELDISKVSVTPDYGNGITGEPFALNNAIADFSLDTNQSGKKNVKVSIDKDGLQGSVDICVEVLELAEQFPNNFWGAGDSGNFFGSIAIFFSETFGNEANVYLENLTEAQKKDVLAHVEFYRNGKKAEISDIEFMTSILTVVVKINGAEVKSYQEGDKLVLKQGLLFYTWKGKIVNNLPRGEGDFVAIGKTACDINFVYGKNGSFKQEIEYSGMEKGQEVIALELDETVPSNVVMTPSYATVGEMSFVVENPDVVSVDVNGNITAKAVGESRIFVYLEGGSLGELSTSFTVQVKDSVTRFDLNAEALTLDLGTELTGEKLNAMGIYGTVYYQSGAERRIDISGASVVGYDKTKKEMQLVSVEITDGEEVREATLTVTLTEARKNEDGNKDKPQRQGCSGSFRAAGILSAFLAFAALYVTVKRSRGSK